MLLLLLMPRGRISAARVAAWARANGDGVAPRRVVRLPAASIVPERHPAAGRDDDHDLETGNRALS